jgi:hypothetical protein
MSAGSQLGGDRATTAAPSSAPPSFDATAASLQSKQERLRRLQSEQLALRRRQAQVQQFAAGYEVEVAWPALVRGNRRTDPGLVQHRLLEAGVLYEVPETLRALTDASSRFVADLERSQCFKAVRVEIGGEAAAAGRGGSEEEGASGDGTPGSARGEGGGKLRSLTVHLQEANWYRLHAGGGVKTSSLLGDQQLQQSSTTAFLPAAELECSLGLRNLTGHLDTTDLQYSIDSQSIASFRLHHRRPLYAALPPPLSDLVLSQPAGSQATLDARAGIDTADHTWTRSYREFQRLLSVRASPSADQRWSAEWSVLGRDLVPQRLAAAAAPYQFAASDEVVSAAGPTVRHALTLEYRPPPLASASPTSPGGTAVRLHGKLQVATPPGDVGYAKVEGGFETTANLSSSSPSSSTSPFPPVEFRTSFRAGYLRHLDFGGLTRARCLSDRFFVGGPAQLRGFGPCGIGPRAAPVRSGPSRGPGDALGGDFYYAGSVVASVPPPGLRFLSGGAEATPPSDAAAAAAAASQGSVAASLRLFGFLNFGTCVGDAGSTPLSSVLRSTRASAGVGVSTSALGPVRLELTYAVPLRYGPRDVRRAFQFGMGLNV